MTDSTTPISVSALDSERAATKSVPDSSPRKLIALLTLVGSSGVLAVFGLIIGELYWSGYLSTFGLTSDEFPASSASVRVYAYIAIIHGLNAVLSRLIELWLLIVLLVLALVISIVASREEVVRSRLVPRFALFRSLASNPSWPGTVTRFVLVLIAMSVGLAVIAYFVLLAWIVLLGPAQARNLGEERGRAEFAKLQQSDSGARNGCSNVDASSLQGKCTVPIAFTDSTVAILSGNRVYRLKRESVNLSSPASAGAAPINALLKP
jgi:hypothetical protein